MPRSCPSFLFQANRVCTTIASDLSRKPTKSFNKHTLRSSEHRTVGKSTHTHTMAQASLSERLKKITTPVPASLFSTLITANHVLHYNSVVDAYGHVSVRNPSNPNTFFLSASVAPALVSNLDDLVEYKVEDASAVKEDAPRGYLERYIHSEIYKKYSEVNSVVHAHAEAVIPFSVSSVPLRAVFHMGGVVSIPSAIPQTSRVISTQRSWTDWPARWDHNLLSTISATTTPPPTPATTSSSLVNISGQP